MRIRILLRRMHVPGHRSNVQLLPKIGIPPVHASDLRSRAGTLFLPSLLLRKIMIPASLPDPTGRALTCLKCMPEITTIRICMIRMLPRHPSRPLLHFGSRVLVSEGSTQTIIRHLLARGSGHAARVSWNGRMWIDRHNNGHDLRPCQSDR
jgi:hypothetical protein